SSDFGTRRRFALARYNPDGSLDPSFRGGRVVTSFADRDEASALALQSDGKIVVAGFSDAGGRQDFALARYNPNGSLDPSFGSGGRALTDFDALALALQPDGKVVVVGEDFIGIGNDIVPDIALARYETVGLAVIAPPVLGVAPDLAP